MVLNLTLAALALLSLILALWQLLLARRFPLHQLVSPLGPNFQLPTPNSQLSTTSPLPAPPASQPRILPLPQGEGRGEGEERVRPTHRVSLPTSASQPPPAVSLLKPLKGCDAETRTCLRSWLEQNYPAPVQVLFGVASADDPVCEEVRTLLAAHPQCDARLVICPETLGANAKVSTLVQLERLVRHDVVVISDADVRVPPEFLGHLVAPLQDARVGLVNSLYRLAKPANPAMRWEAFTVNADFWSQVLQAQSLKPLDFALGAAMATTRTHLARIGGLARVVDYLADDYQLGHRIAQTGARVVLSPVVAECWTAPMSAREVWAHQLRWARTIRVCQPLAYFLSLLGNATLWPLLWLLARPSGLAAAFAALCLTVRMGSGFYLEKKLTRQADLNSLWLGPVKDLLQVIIWALAFAGSRVTWRGERFRVLAGGRLAKP